VDPGLLWITTFVLGAVATVMTVFGPLAAFLTLLIAVPVIVRRPHLVALSGLLTGFGGLWTYLLVRVFTSGGMQDNGTFWLAVGLVPLVIGLALLVFVARHGRARGSDLG
jgi:uncharacterized membrane protein YhaH (DUF805 family)